jgi:hypothetical protein
VCVWVCALFVSLGYAVSSSESAFSDHPSYSCNAIYNLHRYFVMTKKSSFLRQLNLYSFNRFSAGPDQGSYYHEKFLKGLKFLCRQMTRQKVNGNRIRSAGNPDDEPSLALFPVCPPSRTTTATTTNGTVTEPLTAFSSAAMSLSLMTNRAVATSRTTKPDDGSNVVIATSKVRPFHGRNGGVALATFVVRDDGSASIDDNDDMDDDDDDDDDSDEQNNSNNNSNYGAATGATVEERRVLRTV